MSVGLICRCVDVRHPVDPRSVRGELGIRSRCRTYSTDQERGGLCTACRDRGHTNGVELVDAIAFRTSRPINVNIDQVPRWTDVDERNLAARVGRIRR